MSSTHDQNVNYIRNFIEKNKDINQKLWEYISSNPESLKAFEEYLKTAESATIDKKSTVTFKNGPTITLLDSNVLLTKEVFQWVAHGIKNVEFGAFAQTSKLVKSIMDSGRPQKVSFGKGQDSADQPNVFLSGASVMDSWKNSTAASVAQPLIVRCFDSINTLDVLAKDIQNFDFKGEILSLDLLKVVVENGNQITDLLKKKNIKTRRLEMQLTTWAPKAFGADDITWAQLIQAFDGIKNPRLSSIESFKLVIDRLHVYGSLSLDKLIVKVKELFTNMKEICIVREFIGFPGKDTNMDMPVPQSRPQIFTDLKDQILSVDPCLKVEVSWNVLEYYKPNNFKSACTVYRKLLKDFTEDPESYMNLMMSKTEQLSNNKSLYIEFYIMLQMMK